MSLVNAESPSGGAVCRECGHDLKVRVLGDAYSRSKQSSCGRVYCSNGLCRHSWQPYPMFSFISDRLPRRRRAGSGRPTDVS